MKLSTSNIYQQISQLMLLAAGLSGAAALWANEVPFINWENHPVHPLDLSPSGELLAVAHTVDNRVQLFDVSGSRPLPVGHVPVGAEPVSLRFRHAGELWVVNHVSDSISIIDVPNRRVKATILTADEPYDLVFAGNPQRAFVSCSQANLVQVYNPADLNQPPAEIPIDAEDPRALATSPDGGRVYVAIFESGNATTILGAHNRTDADPPNVVLLEGTPYGGASPPPNQGEAFVPARNPALSRDPESGLIVRKSAEGKWLDGNGRDWTQWVSGGLAEESGRVPGWDMPDHDLAVINTSDLGVSYVSGLMNIGMGLAVNPASGNITLIGTEALNEVRFEPNVNARFVRVRSATVNAGNLSSVTADLNLHLDYASTSIPQSQRELSLGDPRGIVWLASGQRGYVAGMGSNTVVVINADGSRNLSVAPIHVGQGPIGLVLNEARGVLYVWNHFDASLMLVSLSSHAILATTPVFSPLPLAIRKGRVHFYDTHKTSGLGQVACASCHVDGRIDRLAWDLGDPSGDMKEFNQNCGTDAVATPCTDFHPIKGPMLTQTLQDIIGHEPFHWRGDRDGLEEFNGAFISLQGDDEGLTAEEMQEFEDFLDTLTFAPNPYRNLDNSLPENLPLPGHVSSGRFSPAGTGLPNGNAQHGLTLFKEENLANLPDVEPPSARIACVHCHSLPTGMAPNSRMFDPVLKVFLGGRERAPGPNGENHLLIHGVSTLQSMTMKVPQMRNLHERTGYETKRQNSRAGFGFQHDGTVDSLAHYVSLLEFDTESDQDVADLVAFMLAFSGSDLPTDNPAFKALLDDSQDSHAAVGQQVTLSSPAADSRLHTLLQIADGGGIEVIAQQTQGLSARGWQYQPSSGHFISDDGSADRSLDSLLGLASDAWPVTFSAVPAGLGERLGLDRDGDGVYNGVELAQYSNPADAQSTEFTPEPGHWLNHGRSGHGMDLQRSGNNMVATWYTYREDGTPHWYQAVGKLQGKSWTGELYQATWNPVTTSIDIEVVGEMTMDFTTARSAEFSWQIGANSGSETFTRFEFANGFTPFNYTGMWYDNQESGWGVSVDSLASTRIVLVFFYDANNQPRWVLGFGNNASGTRYDMFSYTGFCPWCTTTGVNESPAGNLRLDFNGSRLASVDMGVDYPALKGSLFVRKTNLVPLSNEDVKPVSW